MATSNRHPEAAHKKPTVKSSVDSLIGRKKAEKEAKVAESTSQKMAGTKEGVADVMSGMEKPKEKISEREGESGEKGDIKGGGGVAGIGDQAQAISATIMGYIFPPEIIMVKKIRAAINAQIKVEWENAKKFQKNLDSGGADGYNKSISRIRHLKEILASMYTMTVGFLKNMYVRYFTPDGNRREIDEID